MYRLFSEYSVLLQYFGNILKYTVVMKYKNIGRCVNLLLKRGYCWLKESPPPDIYVRE
jgi:hypothetical protein